MAHTQPASVYIQTYTLICMSIMLGTIYRYCISLLCSPVISSTDKSTSISVCTQVFPKSKFNFGSIWKYCCSTLDSKSLIYYEQKGSHDRTLKAKTWNGFPLWLNYICTNVLFPLIKSRGLNQLDLASPSTVNLLFTKQVFRESLYQKVSKSHGTHHKNLCTYWYIYFDYTL